MKDGVHGALPNLTTEPSRASTASKVAGCVLYCTVEVAYGLGDLNRCKYGCRAGRRA